jgi:hypothetical protein
MPTVLKLAAQLEQCGGDYQVLLDHSTLKLGEDWRSAINVWCGACDAAILLVTEDSMVAEYCQYEWSILGYRRATSPTFKIIPVYLGTMPKQIADKPHQIAAVQGVTFSTMDEAWPKIEGLLEGTGSTDSPTRTQARLIGSLIRRVINDPNNDLLRAALSKVDLHLGAWEPLQDPWEQFALQMSGLGLVKAAPALMDIQWAFQKDKGAWNDILEMVAGSWVDDRSAQRLAARCAGDPNQRVVALNASDASLGRPYVVKASGRPPSGTWCMASAPDTAADMEELKSHIARALSHALLLDDSASPELLAKRLKNRETIRQPVIVYLATTSLDATWLQELRLHFQYVTFFLLAGSDKPPLADLEWMVPELPDHFEESVWRDYDDAKKECALP